MKAKKNPELEFAPQEKIFTVGEYIELLNVFLKREEVKIIGEVTQVQRAPSGHVYFSVKDAKGDATLSCILWKFNYARCGVSLETGMEVVLTGHPQIYPQTGRFSFVADTVELHGEGALKKAYDALKKKLSEEGLFAPERKRVLQPLPHKIGVITSREGAVIHDFENNLGKFGFQINFVDARVEGQQAVHSLIEAIHTLKKIDIEVLVIIRGGGSLESLQAFNNETLIRELVDFPVPVIAGIGHDQDVPLTALAADYMASTPTAVAHLLNQSWEEEFSKLQQIPHLLNRITQQLKELRADIDLAWKAVVDHAAEKLKYIEETLSRAEQSVRLNNPTRQLKLGYSIVRKGDTIIRSVVSLKKGDACTVQLSDGDVVSTVEKINL